MPTYEHKRLSPWLYAILAIIGLALFVSGFDTGLWWRLSLPSQSASPSFN